MYSLWWTRTRKVGQFWSVSCLFLFIDGAAGDRVVGITAITGRNIDNDGHVLYRVLWKDKTESWERKTNLVGAHDLLSRYDAEAAKEIIDVRVVPVEKEDHVWVRVVWVGSPQGECKQTVDLFWLSEPPCHTQMLTRFSRGLNCVISQAALDS